MSDEIPTVKITIDGQEVDAAQGDMIIEVADEKNIYIPRFCYHRKLSVAANCRMCLVEVEKSRKPMPACATPVTDGMVVHTKSPKTLAHQKAVMEFLLINHPLDCPICDQGGECELQDLSMGYGSGSSRFKQQKTSVRDKDIGPLISTELTRCIQCTRCVRFGVEIAGEKELGMLERGEHAQIGAFVGNTVESEMSGNMIDICPVGALTSKPFRFQARSWEMNQKHTISPHDSVGSNLYAYTRRGQLLRVTPKENESINEVWLSNRDRYSYCGVNSDKRARAPMIKRDGEFEAVTWDEALKYVHKKLTQVQEKHGGESIGWLASPSQTTEEYYLFNKLARGLGSPNVDHRLRHVDFSHQDDVGNYPVITCEYADIEQSDFVMLVGSDLRNEQPIVHHKVRSAWRNYDAKVAVINPADFDIKVDLTVNAIVNQDDIPLLLTEVASELVAQHPTEPHIMTSLKKMLGDHPISDHAKQIAKCLGEANSPTVFYGALAILHPKAHLIFSLLRIIMSLVAAKGGPLTYGSNTAGAWIAGAIPHRNAFSQPVNKAGMSAGDMLSDDSTCKAFITLGMNPELDTQAAARAVKLMSRSEFVVALSAFEDSGLVKAADVILPISTHYETSGTYMNNAGAWQSFEGVSLPPGQARPAWKVLRVLGNVFDIEDFDYQSTDEIFAKIQSGVESMPSHAISYRLSEDPLMSQTQVKRIPTIAPYATDSLVRHSEPLQQTAVMQNADSIKLSTKLADKLGISDKDVVSVEQAGVSVKLIASIEEGISDQSVIVSMARSKTSTLNDPCAPLTLSVSKKGQSA